MTGESSSCVREAAERRGDLLVQRRCSAGSAKGWWEPVKRAALRFKGAHGPWVPNYSYRGANGCPSGCGTSPAAPPTLAGRPDQQCGVGGGDAQGSAGGFSGCCCQLRRALQLLPAAGARLSLPSKRCLGAGLLLATAGAMVSKSCVPHVSFRGLGELRALREPLWGADAFSPCSHAAGKACGGICLLQIASNS